VLVAVAPRHHGCPLWRLARPGSCSSRRYIHCIGWQLLHSSCVCCRRGSAATPVLMVPHAVAAAGTPAGVAAPHKTPVRPHSTEPRASSSRTGPRRVRLTGIDAPLLRLTPPPRRLRSPVWVEGERRWGEGIGFGWEWLGCSPGLCRASGSSQADGLSRPRSFKGSRGSWPAQQQINAHKKKTYVFLMG
jgi:hypothetical protein